jgi:hypothetical protein
MSLNTAGLGGTVDLIATNRPFYGFDSVCWYVHFATGVDAVAPAGRDKQAPLKTLRQAVTNASENDVIMLLDGHDEALLAPAIALNKRGLIIVGCGQTAGVPNVKLRNGATTSAVFTVVAANVQIRNISFLESTDLIVGGQSRIAQTGAGVGLVIDGCRFSSGPKDNTPWITIAADYTALRNTTFISTAVDSAVRPAPAVALSGSGIRLDGVVFSDGVFGFNTGYALEVGVATDLKGDAVSFLLGASAKIGPTSTGYLIPVVTGGGSIDV